MTKVKPHKTLRERLQIYEDALIDLETKSHEILYLGFCDYFWLKKDIPIHFAKRSEYPNKKHLGSLFPELWDAYNIAKPYDDVSFWFQSGDMGPRIKLLIKALEITEDKIKKYKS